MSRKIIHLKYGKTGHMGNKKKNLDTNNPRFQRRIFKVTSTQPEYFSKIQKSLNLSKSNSKSLSITNQIKLKNGIFILL